MTLDEITGGLTLRRDTITGSDGSRWPTANELQGARYQGGRVELAGQQLADRGLQRDGGASVVSETSPLVTV